MSNHVHAQVKPTSSPAPSFTPAPSRLLQRKCACGGAPGVDGMCAACRQKRLSGLQAKLVVNKPGDRYEQEADRIADQVMRMPDAAVQRQSVLEEEDEDEVLQMKSLSAQITPLVQCKTIDEERDDKEEEALQRQALMEEEEEEEDEEEMLRAMKVNARVPTVTSSLEAAIQSVRRSSAHPLDRATRAFMEPRFGQDFRHVRIHTGTAAANAARAVGARAFTIGSDVVFGQGNYTPEIRTGQRLLAHELAHVMQQRHTPTFTSPLLSTMDREHEAQGASGVAVEEKRAHGSHELGSGSVQRQHDPAMGNPLDDPRMHPSGAPKATACSPPSWCPEQFCQPYSSESYARHRRTSEFPWLMAGIAFAVDSRVVPLWREHLLGGSAPKDLTSVFGTDFTGSKTTTRTTGFLLGELQKSLQASPPIFPVGQLTANIDIASRIGSAISEIDDPNSRNQMNFSIPKEVPGNLAGGVGKDQSTCKAGARPSPFNDSRKAIGSATVTRDASGDLLVTPVISYIVKDTIDLCPGDCGTRLEQMATIPISQFEATGISGDVPFTVEFPANATPFTISAAVPPPTPGITPKETKGGEP
jgi:hypothetical protein